jgi:hypothetical protein
MRRAYCAHQLRTSAHVGFQNSVPLQIRGFSRSELLFDTLQDRLVGKLDAAADAVQLENI